MTLRGPQPVPRRSDLAGGAAGAGLAGVADLPTPSADAAPGARNLDVAPTVASYFGVGRPSGGYDGRSLL